MDTGPHHSRRQELLIWMLRPNALEPKSSWARTLGETQEHCRMSSDSWRRKGRLTSQRTPNWQNSSESLNTVKPRSRQGGSCKLGQKLVTANINSWTGAKTWLLGTDHPQVVIFTIQEHRLLPMHIDDAKAQVKAAGWSAVFSAARPWGIKRPGPEWTDGRWLAATVGGVGRPMLVCTLCGHVKENGGPRNLQLRRELMEFRQEFRGWITAGDWNDAFEEVVSEPLWRATGATLMAVDEAEPTFHRQEGRGHCLDYFALGPANENDEAQRHPHLWPLPCFHPPESFCCAPCCVCAQETEGSQRPPGASLQGHRGRNVRACVAMGLPNHWKCW